MGNSNLRRSVRNIKALRRKQFETFHTDTLKANFRSTVNLSYSSSQYVEITIPEDNIQASGGSVRPYDKLYNSNFFYKGLSTVIKSSDTTSEYLHKTQNLRKMKYLIGIQKETICRNKEEQENQLEEVKDKINSLKDSKELFEGKFLPTFNQYIKILNKQVEFEKYLLARLQTENNNISRDVGKLDYTNKQTREKLKLMREYKMFLHCLKHRKSLSDLKRSESMRSRRSIYLNNLVNASPSPKRSLKAASHIFKFDSALMAALNYEQETAFDSEMLTNQFTILEKDILDNMRRYDYNQVIINQIKKEITDITGNCCDEVKEDSQTSDIYVNMRRRNDELRRELAFAKEVTHRSQLTKQIQKIYYYIFSEFAGFITKVDEEDPLFKKQILMLTSIEKVIDFLLTKYHVYRDNNILNNPLKEIEKNNDKLRRSRQFLKKKVELDIQNQKRIEKEQRKYLDLHGNSKIRKIAPRVKPSSKEVTTKNQNQLSLTEEFKDLIIF
jgi:hypothetical protein